MPITVLTGGSPDFMPENADKPVHVVMNALPDCEPEDGERVIFNLSAVGLESCIRPDGTPIDTALPLDLFRYDASRAAWVYEGSISKPYAEE